MESAVADDTQTKDSSYTYWVRKKTEQAAPDPVPRKLSSFEVAQVQQPTTLGSVWNQAGTWEERCITKWATSRLKELLMTLEPLRLEDGYVQVTEVTRCAGEASLVTVRNKKRHGYSYEITLKFKGDWRGVKDVEGTLVIPEASYNDLDDLKVEVDLSSADSIEASEKAVFCQELRSFLDPIRDKLQTFEEELKAR
ncbi:hypothetical protein KP509_23G056400 [Ceratopteris richardii]|uniref:Activator of Hsp90 ATPase AHSA1-like N-terminal domain-containing protein n=2 Tax=Ceratopteris richardii TaxID=49495 RepID=A0A8T2S014_CERRI|nr:hypothetical protein KP509_23G056400 [Ceratopteris richardii]